MFTKLLKAIEDDSLDSFNRLLKTASKNVFYEKDEEYGATLIHWAAIYNDEATLESIRKFLIKSGLKEHELLKIFCEPDRLGRTPLHWCVFESELNSCQYLLGYFNELAFISTKRGLMPLHLAAKVNQLPIVDILCKFDENREQGKDWLVSANTKKKLLAIDLATDATVKLRLKNSSLRDHACFPFLGEHLSTHRNYLSESPVESSPLKQNEQYPRSGKHHRNHELGPKADIYYTKRGVKLEMGMKAHVGTYGNLLQMKGDWFEPEDNIPEHHPSDAILYDSILNYKNNLCKNVIVEFNEKCQKSLITVGHWNDYPCVMVHIPDTTIHKAQETKKPSAGAFEDWVNFILSYFLGLLNFSAYQKNLPIETERRGGFGFSTPTVAPTNASFRINMGILPKDYITLLVETLVTLNNVLEEIVENKIQFPKLPKSLFYGSEEHIDYLNEKYEVVELDDMVELLWAQVEKAGRTTVQNMMRSTYARESIAQIVFTYCYEQGAIKPLAALNHTLLWCVKRIKIKGDKLTFQTEEDVTYPVRFKNTPYICEDTDFWNMITLLHDTLSKSKDEVILACLKNIADCKADKNIEKLYFNLDLLNEAIFANAMDTAEETYGDGYGSDSEEEGIIQNKNLFAKKVVTHSGMRAIWAAVTAVSSILGNIRVYLQNAYYETPLGMNMIKQLHQLNSVTLVKNISEANLVIYDLNACITTGSNSKMDSKTFKKVDRYIILDATSATSTKIHDYLMLLENSRVRSMLVAESGYKNQQLAGDKNQHGIVRIFSTDKKQRETLYASIKKTEQPLLSATSHNYRHKMKFFGATLSNEAILLEPQGRNLEEKPSIRPKK